MLDENRNVVSEWKFSDFFNSVNFISEGDNFDHLVRGMASEAQGNLDRHFPTSVKRNFSFYQLIHNNRFTNYGLIL